MAQTMAQTASPRGLGMRASPLAPGREAAETVQDDDGAVGMGHDRVGERADERGAGTSPAAGPSPTSSADIDASTSAGAGPPAGDPS